MSLCLPVRKWWDTDCLIQDRAFNHYWTLPLRTKTDTLSASWPRSQRKSIACGPVLMNKVWMEHSLTHLFTYCLCLLSGQGFSDLMNLQAGSPGVSDGKESACNAGDLGSIPGLGRSPGEGNNNTLQYSCLENSMDRGAWWATVHGVAQNQTRLSYQHLHFRVHFHTTMAPLSGCNGNCMLSPFNHVRLFGTPWTMQGSSEDADRENRLVDTCGKGEGSMETYPLPYAN